MALSWNEIKNRAINFSKEWETEEKQLKVAKKLNSEVAELKETINTLIEQRDKAMSKLLAAQMKIIELTNKINRLDGGEKEL